MPHTHSAEKRGRQNVKRRLYNRQVMSALKTSLKRAEEAARAGDAAKSQPVLREAVSLLDKAVAKGVLHRNTVARRKSSLMRMASAGIAAAGKKA